MAWRMPLAAAPHHHPPHPALHSFKLIPTCRAPHLPFQPTSPLHSKSHIACNSNTTNSLVGGSSSGLKQVCVVGAGVAGLTSALRLLQSFPDKISVTVLAEKYGTDTTSTGAAGIWGPYKLSNTSEVLIHRWGKETYQHLMQLFHSDQAPQAGVSVVTSHHLQRGPVLEPQPFWKDIPMDYAAMSQEQLDLFKGDNFMAGFSHTSIVCEGRYYLRWLMQQIQQYGGHLQQCKLDSLQSLSCHTQDFDAVVNCSGLGASSLVPDQQMYPIRGQIVRVRAPWITHAYFADPYYIIPNRNFVILGGTGQVGNWSNQTSLEDKQRIFEGCCNLMPSLAHAEVIEDWVGLRPGRPKLRLEVELLDVGDNFEEADWEGGKSRTLPVIHNYGHGGAGLTLAWGCAGDVVRMLEQHI